MSYKKYATRSKHLNHDWYLAQVEVCSNVIFKSVHLCTSLFERLLDKFSRVGLPGEADLFDQPVLDHKGMKVTAPDLRKNRQLSLCRELLKPKYAVHGFRTIDLKKTLNEFSNFVQIRYEMVKLISRGAVKKQKNKSF